MMSRIMEKAGLALLAVAAIAYLVLLVDISLQDAQAGLIVLAGVGGSILIFAQVLKDRLENKEDDYYSKNVEK